MIQPENWKATCVACKKEVHFASGFTCTAKPGNHRVSNVRFYHTGGGQLQHPRDRRGWGPTLLYCRPDKLGAAGKLLPQPPLLVQFLAGGLLDSEDAEVQFNLMTNSKGVGWGEQGRLNWEKTYLTTDQQAHMAQIRLDDINRQITERNDLLEQTKVRTGKRNQPETVGA